jgi:MoxR-like ATPase
MTAPDAPAALRTFYETVERVLVGQRPLLDRLLIALLTDGHVLIEGVPGLAKTLAVRTVSAALSLGFKRVQFTPDLLPADVIGGQVYSPATGQFTVRPGPVFTNVLLADEVNRAPAKVQSALLEAMQERQATIGETTLPLPRPFFVLATQNPVEQEGTYPLPEAQLDRFMLKVLAGYPTRDDERAVLDRMGGVDADTHVEPVLTAADLHELRGRVDAVHCDEKIKGYILDLVRATRTPGEFGLGDLQPLVQYGASPRATLALFRAAKGLAFLLGRGYVLPADVKALAPDVLRHRVIVSYEAEADEVTADRIVERVVAGVAVP